EPPDALLAQPSIPHWVYADRELRSAESPDSAASLPRKRQYPGRRNKPQPRADRADMRRGMLQARRNRSRRRKPETRARRHTLADRPARPPTVSSTRNRAPYRHSPASAALNSRAPIDRTGAARARHSRRSRTRRKHV